MEQNPSPFAEIPTAQLPDQYNEFRRLFDLSLADLTVLQSITAEMKMTAFASRAIAQAQMFSLNNLGLKLVDLKRVCKTVAAKKAVELARYYAQNHRKGKAALGFHGMDIQQDAYIDDVYAAMKQDQDLREAWIDYLTEVTWQLKSRRENLELTYADTSRD